MVAEDAALRVGEIVVGNEVARNAAAHVVGCYSLLAEGPGAYAPRLYACTCFAG
jgi:hypothetical protein